MQLLINRPLTTAGIALVGIGIVTVTPVTAPASAAAAQLVDIQLTAEDITLDLVRHGQSTDDASGILGTLPPGAHLTDLGEQQAKDVAVAIQQEFPDGLSGIYASELVRTQETAAPLAHDLGMTVQVLPDLNEIPAGVVNEGPRNLFNEAAFFAPMASWILGNLFATEPGISYNGAQFEEQMNSAVDAIYNNTVSGNGPATDVAVSSGGSIAIWTLLNVKNPDFLAIIESVLKNGGPPPNAGQDIIEGNPTDGWTLVSWDGIKVPTTPDLFTGLFVDWRDLNMVEQLALWHVWEAIQGGDQTDISNAIHTGFNQVVAALEQFPQSVIDTITQATSDGTGGAGGAAVESLGDVIGSLPA